MEHVNATSVVAIEERRRRISRAVAARRRLDRAPFPSERRGRERRAGGRVWVNGIEVGGTDPRHTPLAFSHD
jgi:hypothetical protein